MKTLKLLTIFILLLTSQAISQLRLGLDAGTPPPWGPAGYSGVRYYYLPDLETYYDVQRAVFIYSSGGVWIYRVYLPVRYRNYDLYNGYKVVMINYRGNRPYIYHSSFKVKFAKGYRGKTQKTIGKKPGKSNSNVIKPSKGNASTKPSDKQPSNKGSGKKGGKERKH